MGHGNEANWRLSKKQGANPFRVGAYRRAAETAAAHGEELTEVLDRDGLEGLIGHCQRKIA